MNARKLIVMDLDGTLLNEEGIVTQKTKKYLGKELHLADDEILVKVISDSICMSTYKCAILGTEHKRVHEDVAEHPAIMGHEFAGDIIKV